MQTVTTIGLDIAKSVFKKIFRLPGGGRMTSGATDGRERSGEY
jgi:hypothetical protein